jgi:hypothetical protein
MNLTNETFAIPSKVLEYCNTNMHEILERTICTLDDIEISNYYLFEYNYRDKKDINIVIINRKQGYYISFTTIFVKKYTEENFTQLETPIKEDINWCSLGAKLTVGNIIIKHINSDYGICSGTNPNKPNNPNLSFIEKLDRLNGYAECSKITHSEPEKVLVPEQIVDNVDYKDNMTCKICFNNKINIVCIPCGHCFCSECNTQSKNSLCAVCREPITKTQTLFI